MKATGSRSVPIALLLVTTAVAVLATGCSEVSESFGSGAEWTVEYSSEDPGLCVDLITRPERTSFCWDEKGHIGAVARKTVGGREYILGFTSPAVTQVSIAAPGAITTGAAAPGLDDWSPFLQIIPLGEGPVEIGFLGDGGLKTIVIGPDEIISS